MLASKFRLPIKDFKKSQVFKNTPTPYFIAKSVKSNLSYNRLGVIISSKVITKATKRNYWKRRITQNFQTWPQIGQDVLIIVNPNIKNLKEPELGEEMSKILKKIK